jgi:2-pyrone-4,6-dicarboxylate lactonase
MSKSQREKFPEWIREVRAPAPLPPPRSCDCQFHIYEDPAKFPPKHDPWYEPPRATFEDAKRVLRTLGLERGVIVYPMPYDTDNRLLFHVLEGFDAEEKRNFRATCIVKREVPDAELERLKTLGVVGARFNIGKKWGETHALDEIRRNMDRVREIGWHARLHVSGADLLELSDFLRSIKNLTLCIDHMAHLDLSLGLEQPAMKWILDILERDNWWMMVSNGNRLSPMDRGWDDAVPFGRAFVRVAPARVIWGSDWPHVRWRKRMMNDAEEVELMYQYFDGDSALQHKVLVDNPARLHGFGL